MDKNTVLAFVLMGIVLIGMPYYNDFFFPQEPVTEQVETERTAPDQDRDPQQSTPPVMQEEMQSSDQLAAKPETVSEKPASETKERLPESTIHVSSPLYSGKITTRGGVISSWNIDAYENRSGGPVAMVDPGKRANLGISFRTMDGDTVHSIQNDFYLVGRDSRSEHRLTVNPDNQETITLRCDLDEQRYIEKRYTFFGDRYDIELEVVLKGIAPDVVDGKYFIHWDSAVPMSENNPKDELKYVKSYALLGSDIEDFEVDEEEVEVLNLSGNTQWISTRTKYFGAAVIPQDNVGSGAILRGYQQEYGEEINREYSLSLAMPMGQEQVVSDKFIVFMGPLEYTLINGYNVDLEQMMDFGWKYSPARQNDI